MPSHCCVTYWVIATPWFFLLSMFYASLYWDHCPVAWPKWSFSSSSDCLAFGSTIVWCRGPVAAKSTTKSSSLKCCAWQRCLCRYDLFVFCQTSLFWSHLFKGHWSRRLVVFEVLLLGFLQFLWACKVWPLGNSAGASTHGKIVSLC